MRCLSVLRRPYRVKVVLRRGADCWRILTDFARRAARHDAGRFRPAGPHILATPDPKARFANDGTTWPDQQPVARERISLAHSAFGMAVEGALERGRRHYFAHSDACADVDGRVCHLRDPLRTL